LFRALYVTERISSHFLSCREAASISQTTCAHDCFESFSRGVLITRDAVSSHDNSTDHISRFGQVACRDFERCAVAGDVIYSVEGDSMSMLAKIILSSTLNFF